jgi:hypothetical protein
MSSKFSGTSTKTGKSSCGPGPTIRAIQSATLTSFQATLVKRKQEEVNMDSRYSDNPSKEPVV